MGDDGARFPQRPPAHVVGDAALRAFQSRIPPEWTVNEARQDYGWDLNIDICEEGHVTPWEFRAQLKGTETPSLTGEGRYASIVMKSSTMNWLRKKPIPTLLCLCDVASASKLIYWTWLEDALKGLEARNKHWPKQRTATVHVPCANVLSSAACTTIAEEVKQRCKYRELAQVVGGTVYEAFAQSNGAAGSHMVGAEEFLDQRLRPSLLAARAAIDVGGPEKAELVGLSEDEINFNKRIDSVSAAIDAMQDNEASRLMAELETDLGKHTPATQARLHNNRGVLLVRSGNLLGAREQFARACELHSRESKFEGNLLSCQYWMSREQDKTSQCPLPSGWDDRLRVLLEKESAAANYANLKANRLCDTRGVEAATDYMRRTQAWEQDRVTARCNLAAIQLSAGEIDAAIETLLEVVEETEAKRHPFFSGLLGSALSLKAVGLTKPGPYRLPAFGPPEKDIKLLNKAKEHLDRAYAIHLSKGLPAFAVGAVLQYAGSLHFLGEFRKAETVCRTCLERHPNEADVLAHLTTSLALQGRYTDALKHARRAFEIDDSTSNFRNYVLTCYATDQHEDVIAAVNERSYTNGEEEGFARRFRSIAYALLGDDANAGTDLNVLRKRPDWAIDAVLAEVEITRQRDGDRSKAAAACRTALKEHPNNTEIMNVLVSHLVPVSKDNASEVAECLEKMSAERSLLPQHLGWLGSAYALSGRVEDAERTLVEALENHPNEPSILLSLANVLTLSGDDARVLEALRKYLSLGERHPKIYINAANAAYHSGQLDDAVSLLTRAAPKAESDAQAREIHSSLFALRKVRGDAPRDLVREVMAFGRRTDDDVDAEAQFLIMALLAPRVPESGADGEMNEWRKEIKSRLTKFSAEHPDHPALSTHRIPDGLEGDAAAEAMLVEIAAMTLPHRLHEQAVAAAGRSTPLPFLFRSRFFARNQFDYWDSCTNSDDFAHAVHIRNMSEPSRGASQGLSLDAVCVDITFLLTLAQFDLLDPFARCTSRIYISGNVRADIEKNAIDLLPDGVHPTAKKLREWRLRNADTIRVKVHALDEEELDEYELGRGGMYVRSGRAGVSLLGPSVAETVEIAASERAPLFCDDWLVRSWATETKRVVAFSTIDLLQHWRANGLLALKDHVHLLAEMIHKNFRFVPFTIEHINAALRRFAQVWLAGHGKLPTYSDFFQDSDLSAFLGVFSDRFTDERQLAGFVARWWLEIAGDDQLLPLLEECMYHACSVFAFAKTDAGVLTGIDQHEPQKKLALLVGSFIWLAYRRQRDSVADVWSATKSLTTRLFPRAQDESTFEALVYRRMWDHVVIAIEQDGELTDDQKASCYVNLPTLLPHHDRNRIETYLASRSKPGFVR